LAWYHVKAFSQLLGTIFSLIHYFWLIFFPQSENGFSVVEAFVKKGGKAIDALSVYLSERAKIEKEYAESLQKLLKKTEAITEFGSMDKIWQKARQEFENEVNLHTGLAQELKVCGAAVATSEKDLKKQSKAHLETASKVSKDFQHMSQAIAKGQQKYHKSCMDNQKIDQEVTAAQSNPKNLAKVRTRPTGLASEGCSIVSSLPQALEKQKKGQKEQASAEQEYQSSIQKLTAFQPTYEDKTKSSLDVRISHSHTHTRPNVNCL